MNNDIANVTKPSFTSTPQVNSRVSNVHDVQDKRFDKATDSTSDPGVERFASNKEANETDDKQKQNLVSLDDVRKLAEQGNEILDQSHRNLQFKVDEATHRVVVSVVDRKSGEVLRQIPSEEVLALAKRLKSLDGEEGQGVFLQERA